LGFEKEAVPPVPLAGLQSATQYTFCLLARNKAGETALGAPETFTTLAAPPTVLGESAAVPVKASEATLQATINPNNQKTSFAFEYTTEEALIGTPGATKVNGEGTLSGFGPQPVSVATGGVLKADKTYFYRVVAENQQQEGRQTGQGADRTLHDRDCPGNPGHAARATDRCHHGDVARRPEPHKPGQRRQL
jgi:hypothetical protein